MSTDAQARPRCVHCGKPMTIGGACGYYCPSTACTQIDVAAARAAVIRPRQPSSTDAILDERGKRYGKFEDHARITRRLKAVIVSELRERQAARPVVIDDDMQEALDMICHKIGRIVNGDPQYEDSWRDIAGYAQLVADRLKGVAR